MARRSQDNPALDMTPMIDVVFELIIFFVVTLTEAQKKDETIELEDGKSGIVLTPEELPPTHMMIDIGQYGLGPKRGQVRVSMGDRDITMAEISKRVKERKDRYGEFPVLIRADYATPHGAVASVMNAVTAAGIWKISFVATQEDKTYKGPDSVAKALKAFKETGKRAAGSPRGRLLTAFPNQRPKAKKGGN